MKRSCMTRWRRIISCNVNVTYTLSQYLPNGKAYELQTWYTDGARRTVSSTSAVTSKVKCQGRTWCVWQVLADTPRTKRPRNTNIGKKVSHPTGNNAHRFQGQTQRSRSPGRLMLRPERPTNFKFGTQMEYEDNVKGQRSRLPDKLHDHQSQRWRSRCHVVRLTDVSP